MTQLLLKIFLAYWLAAGIVIFVSDYEPHRHIHLPELQDALDSSIAINGRALISAYDAGGCADAQRLLTSKAESLALASSEGRLLCGDPGITNLHTLIGDTLKSGKRTTANSTWFQTIAVPITSAAGTHYVLLLKSRYSSALHIDGMLPGYTTIAISCVVTVFLGLLLALPIRRLRKAAGQIAMGRLSTRVRWGWFSGRDSPVVGDDIDQLVRDFNHMAERLESLADAQRLLLRDVSHELRSPLTRMGVGLGLARKAASVEMRPHLDRIETESVRLNGLIGHILSLSQMDSAVGQVELPAVLSLKDVVSDLLPDVEYEASRGLCSITTSFGPECLVRGDPDLLRAAIENILRNSIKYSCGPGEIHVETGQDEEGGESFATLRVADNGPGIPEHEIQAVLKPFYRADRVRHWQSEGSGIGLAIADRAARLHGGTISLRNRHNGGLLVELRLPVAMMA